MIIPIRNQPITFSPAEGETAACGDTSNYCQLVRLGDKLCFQLRQSSCLPQLLCNNEFSEASDDLVSPYGDFTTEADFDAFLSDNLTWYWDEYGRRACTFEAGAHFGGLIQFNIDTYGLASDCRFVLTFDVSEYDAPGDEQANGELILTLPDGTTKSCTANGSYSFTSGQGSSFSFDPGVDNNWCIDNITLRCAGSCWEFDYADPATPTISLGSDGLCKVEDGVTTVTEENGTLTVGKYYQLIVDVRSSTVGSIEFFLGTVSIGTVDENGIFTLSGISDGTEFSFVMSDLFDGCVKSVSLYQLSQDYTLKLKNVADDSVTQDLTSSIVYNGDWIEACILFDENITGAIFADLVDNVVCMYLELESPADGDIIVNGEFDMTNSLSVLDDWGFTGTLEYKTIQGQVILDGGTGYLIQDLSGAGFVQGNTYYVAFDIYCLDYGEGEPDFDSFTASLGSTNTGSLGTEIWDSDTFPQSPGHYVYKVIAGSDGDFLAFHFTDANGLVKVCIDNVRVRNTPCEHELLTSNCIKFANMNGDTLGWEGSKLFTACNEEGVSMGFNWATGFMLQMRAFADLVTSRYPSKEDETYLQSNSVRKRVFADTSKVFDLKIHEVDELAHDCFRTMFKCDHLWIEDGYQLQNEYISLDAEYAPEQDSKGRLKLTEAQVEVQKIDNTLFNTNCG